MEKNLIDIHNHDNRNNRDLKNVKFFQINKLLSNNTSNKENKYIPFSNFNQKFFFPSPSQRSPHLTYHYSLRSPEEDRGKNNYKYSECFYLNSNLRQENGQKILRSAKKNLNQNQNNYFPFPLNKISRNFYNKNKKYDNVNFVYIDESNKSKDKNIHTPLQKNNYMFYSSSDIVKNKNKTKNESSYKLRSRVRSATPNYTSNNINNNNYNSNIEITHFPIKTFISSFYRRYKYDDGKQIFHDDTNYRNHSYTERIVRSNTRDSKKQLDINDMNNNNYNYHEIYDLSQVNHRLKSKISKIRMNQLLFGPDNVLISNSKFSKNNGNKLRNKKYKYRPITNNNIRNIGGDNISIYNSIYTSSALMEKKDKKYNNCKKTVLFHKTKEDLKKKDLNDKKEENLTDSEKEKLSKIDD